MRKLTCFITLLVIQFTASAEPELRGTANELAQHLRQIPKTVTVAGEAEVRVPAHRAVVSLKVVTENRSLQEAFRLNADLRARLTDYLKKQGIQPERIHAAKFSSTPQFGIFGDKAKSYRVENTMRIAVQDDREFQSTAAAVDQSSEVQFGGVEFEYADKEVLKAKAVSAACDNATERKKMYEDKLGLVLTPASFSEGAVGQRDVVVSNYAGAKLYTSLPRSSAEAAAPAQEGLSSFGELVYTARIVVEYTVREK